MSDLYERLLIEDASSLPDIEQALYAKKKELAIVKQDIKQAIHTLEKASKQKSPDEIDSLLKGLGSPASLDRSFEGGIVSLKITPELKVKLQSYDTAKEALKSADATTVSIGSDMEKISKLPDIWTAITKDTLDILILNHPVDTTTQVTTEAERDILTEKMDKLGYRPLELSELIALGILKPEFTKDGRNEVLNSMKKYSLGGHDHVPCLFRSGDERRLGADWSPSDWGDWSRFLFVRK